MVEPLSIVSKWTTKKKKEPKMIVAVKFERCKIYRDHNELT
jgi:hypothetical protein